MKLVGRPISAAVYAVYLFSVLSMLLLLVQPSNAANNEAVAAQLKAIFVAGKVDTGSQIANKQLAELEAFYQRRDYKPLWTRDKGPKGKAKALVAELRSAQVHGLSSDFYNLTQINELFGSKDPADLARLELLLDGALVEFGRDLANGRIGPHNGDALNAIASKPTRVPEYVERAQETGNLRRYLSGLLQSDKRYVRLIAKHVEYLRTAASGQLPAIPAGGTAIKAGQSNPRMIAIRKFLVISGDMPIAAMGDGPKHDETSVEAIRKFQKRHGLTPGDDIDSATLSEMTKPIGERISQIKSNLERRRWQVANIDSDHLYVNLADGSMRLVKGGKTAARFKMANQEALSNVPAFVGELHLNTSSDASDEVKISSGKLQKVTGENTADGLQVEDFPAFQAALNEHFGNSGSKATLPIFVTYVTAWATSNGAIHFRADKAGRDKKLAALLGIAN